jgi:hypothetical protein
VSQEGETVQYTLVSYGCVEAEYDEIVDAVVVFVFGFLSLFIRKYTNVPRIISNPLSELPSFTPRSQSCATVRIVEMVTTSIATGVYTTRYASEPVFII